MTGSARGLGRGLVRAFEHAGWNVAATTRSDADTVGIDAEFAERPGTVLALGADVTVPGAIEAAVAATIDRFGRLDALVHNAVSGRSSEACVVESASEELWEDHASVSLRGLWRCVRAVAEPVIEARGAVVVLTSPAGINGSSNNALYGAVKGGQRAFVRSLAREWGPLGVRVNGLAPLARTEALDRVFAADPDREAALSRIVPLGRFGDPVDDIGPAAVFLCSDAARYVTGQNLVVSGGRLTSSSSCA